VALHFVIVDEVLRLLRARSSRSAQIDRPALSPVEPFGGAPRHRGMPLVIPALHRTLRPHLQCMLARGYDGEVRSLPHPGLRPTDWLVLAVGVSFLLIPAGNWPADLG